MFKPEEQQIEICLLKSNLEEIGNELVLQRSALPALDAENEQKYRETMIALRLTRSLNTEIERLKLENVRLTAKRMQLKQQSDDITKSLERARDSRRELSESLKAEETETELHIREYEDSLQEIVDRFRKTRGYYDEENIIKDLEKVSATIIELEDESKKRKHMTDELKKKLDDTKPATPEDLLSIMGKENVEFKMKQLEEKYKALADKYSTLQDKKLLQ